MQEWKETARCAAVWEVIQVFQFDHMGPYFMDHSWWDFFGWFLPMVLIVLLVALAAWLVARSTRESQQARTPPTGPSTDAALEQARLRYARGEIDREEFVRLLRDLGSTVPETPPEEPATGAPEAGPEEPSSP